MEKLRNVLVTDRAPADVAARNDKGTYNYTDLNRVLRSCAWLAGKLEGYGYSVAGEYLPACVISAEPQPRAAGTVRGAAAYRGEAVTVTAAANDGFTFLWWTEGEEIVSRSPEYRFTADRDRDLTAVFLTPGDADNGIIGVGRVGQARVRPKGE